MRLCYLLEQPDPHHYKNFVGDKRGNLFSNTLCKLQKTESLTNNL